MTYQKFSIQNYFQAVDGQNFMCGFFVLSPRIIARFLIVLSRDLVRFNSIHYFNFVIQFM